MAKVPWYSLTFGEFIRNRWILAYYYAVLASGVGYRLVTDSLAGEWMPLAILGAIPIAYGVPSWLLERRGH